jgi:hypothetical protein
MQAQILQKQKCSDTLVSIGERVVLDDEVQKVRGARLHIGVQRLAIEGLIDGTEYALKLIAAFAPDG